MRACRKIEIGFKSGRLTVTGFDRVTEQGKYKKYTRLFATCKCICGNTHRARADGVAIGMVRSCGCLPRDTARQNGLKLVKHGLSRTTYYSRWCNMITRCTDVKNKAYPNYGGRGIKVCPRWLESFQAYINDVGLPPFHRAHLDRVDNNGN